MNYTCTCGARYATSNEVIDCQMQNHGEQPTDKQKLETLVDLVARMRQAQRDYFAYKQRETLQLSKSLERQIDEFIEQYYNPQRGLI